MLITLKILETLLLTAVQRRRILLKNLKIHTIQVSYYIIYKALFSVVPG
jgi:hypothetical protein